MNTPMVPVSWGELIDKISILQLKEKNIVKEPARSNIRKELVLLTAIAYEPLKDAHVFSLKARLDLVNAKLWEIEDHLRIIEASGKFEAEFVELARDVYRNNDARARIKLEINHHLMSDLIEEKSYSAY